METIVGHRRELHKIPEIGLQEYKTSKYIKDVLDKNNIEYSPILETGVLVYFEAKGSEETIVFRSDIDGLPIGEDTKLPFASTHDGHMHACGHDAHSAILIGMSLYFKKNEANLKKNVVLIFQPAEEGPGGAKLIMEQKLLDKYNPTAVYALHVFPDIKENVIGIKPGPIMAQVCEVDIEIAGLASHGAQPHKGIDSIVIAANIIQQAQHIVSRFTDPHDNLVVSFGKIEGGNRRNIIAQNCKIEGTIRSFNTMKMVKIEEYLNNLCSSMDKIYGSEIKMNFKYDYPAVINDENLYVEFKTFLDKEGYENQLVKSQMLAEDFSYYGSKYPIFFFLVGTQNFLKGHTEPLHSPKFSFDDEVVLPHALELYQKFVNHTGIL